MYTGLQLINEVEDRLNRPQSTTLDGADLKAKTRKLVRLMNRVLKNLVSLEQWPMLRTDGTLLTEAAIDEAEVLLDLTNGSTTVSLSSFDSSSLAFELKHAHWAIQIGTTGTPIYRIVEVLSPTSVKLNRPWLGDDNTPTGGDDDISYQVIVGMDQYVLPEDFDRPTGKWQDLLSGYGVSASDPEKFRKIRNRRGRTLEYGDPLWYTVYGLDPTQTYQVLHLDPWPTQQTLMDYSYQQVHPDIKTDNDLVLFPVAHAGVVIEAVMYFANRDYEDDQRMGAALQEFLTQFNAVKGQNTVVTAQKQFPPSVSYRARSVRLHGGGMRYDYGTFFDKAGAVDLP